VKLNNGDIFPGDLDTITEEHVTLHTDYAGKLRIPRRFVSSISPLTGSGKTIYKGPSLSEEWEIMDAPDTANFQLEEQEPLAQHSWEFHSSAWFSTNRKGSLKKSDLKLPEKYKLEFDLYGKNHSGVFLILAADFKQPEPKQPLQANQVRYITEQFGTCLLLRVAGTSLALHRYYFNEKGIPQQQRIPSTANNIQTLQKSSSHIKVLVDRSKSTIAVHLDGKFLNLWNLSKNPGILDKNGIGFSSYSNRHSNRVSDILIQHWSGNHDDAVSLNHETLDIILLHNGTDRFSGKSAQLDNDQMTLTGSYANYSIPLHDIKEIHFAKESLTPPTDTNTHTTSVQFYGIGKISGTLLPSPAQTLHLQNPILGLLKINTDYLSEIRFSDSLFTLDSWTSKR